MKKLLSLLLVTVMVLSIFTGMQISSSALAPSGKCGENVYWSFDEFTGTLTISGSGDMDRYNYYSNDDLAYESWSDVDCPPMSPFIYNNQITSVIVESGVTSISNGTFQYCANLKSVSIPGTIKSVPYLSFKRCVSLTYVNLGYGINTINQAFIGCSALETINIPNSVVEVNDFYGCNALKNISIPSSVKKLCAFSNCAFKSIDIPYGVEKVGGFFDCKDLERITIPSSVTSFGGLSGCSSIESVTIPNSVKALGSFSGCTALKGIAIPYGVESVGSFYDCKGLESVTIPNSVKTLGGFDGCTALKSIKLPYSIQKLGTFKKCKSLERLVLPYGLEALYARTFDGCESLKSITIPESVTYIGGSCFNNCYSLEEIELPEQLTEIKNGLFYNCKSLKEINLPSGIEKIGDSAFLGCESLKTVRIPEATQTIKNCVFSNCKSLENVYIGANCSSIGYDVFTGCNALKQFEVSENNVTYNDNGNALNEVATHNLIRATENTVIPNDTLTIENVAFSGLDIESVSIPASVISIGQSAFSDCKNLKEVNINDGLSNIAYGAFEGCINLSNIDLPESVSNIESHAFWNCPRLKNVTVNNGDCNIADDYKTFSARAVISGGDNSTAFCYAMNYNRTFRLLNHSEHTWVIDRIIPAKLTRAGKIIYYCAVCDEEDTETIASPKTFTLAKTTYVYTGKAIAPAVTVKDSNGKALVKGTDYTVAYKNNINVGTASAVITFTGNYEGTKTLTFTILPKATNVSLTAAKKSFTAKWGKVAGVTGYQLQYATNAKFTKATTKTIKGAAKVSLKVANLKAGTKYFVRVRTYKTIGGKNYYSTWSVAKAVKTK